MKGISGFYVLIMLLFAGMLAINLQYFQGSSFSNVGITYAREYRISSERSGQVLNLNVVPGQEVKAGDLLVEMENRTLEIEIIKLRGQVAALKKEMAEKTTLAESKIAFLEAEGGIKVEELDAEIQYINSELALNRRLTEEFIEEQKSQSALAEEAPVVQTSPHNIRIGSLEEQKKLYRQATSIRVEDLLSDHQSDMLVLANEIHLKEQELALLQSEREKLHKYASHSGVVTQVLVRKGEEVEAYAPIISIIPRNPGTVVAFVVGPKGREASIGDKVTVTSYNNKGKAVEGVVIGFGSITELPEILQQSTAVKAFGKEIFIQIPEENNFASGEKVLIR